MNIDFYGLVVGLNRNRQVATKNWKGYIDEVKVFNRTFSTDDIITDCMKSDNCPYVLTTPPTLSADPRASSIYLSWNEVVGSDNVTIYWRSSTGFEGSPAAPTASDNIINATNGQTSYFLSGLDSTKYYHFVIKANNQNGSSNVSSVTGNIQPLNFRFRSVSVNSNTLTYINRNNELWVRGNNYWPSEGGNAEILITPRTNDWGEPNSINIDSISNASLVGSGSNKVSAILDNGTIYHLKTNNPSLWWDSYGTETTPTNIPGGTTVVDMRHGLQSVYYLLSDGTILSKGRGSSGRLGNGSTADVTGSTGVFVSGISTAEQIAVGSAHACALLSNGQVWCWGEGTLGELGDGLGTDSSIPVQVSLPTNTAVMIDGNYRDTFALMADGTVYGWGENRGAKVRCSTNTSSVFSPIRVANNVSNVIDIAVGFETTHMLDDPDGDGRGSLWTCGRANKNYDLTNNSVFRTWNDSMGDINFIASYYGVPSGDAINALEYENRLIQIDADRYSLLLIRDDLVVMGLGQSQHKQFSTTDNNGANVMTIFDDNLQPIESTNPVD
jgi:alpha-tubulin suppressor-like RCC1 family protein